MATSEDRMRILKMVQEGKITPEEGAKLISALRDSRPETQRPGETKSNRKGWMRVRVTDMNSGKTKVNVNLPLYLIEAGMNIATHYAPDVNLDDITQAIKDASMTGKIIDVKPNGLLVIEARAKVEHDEEISTITLTGTCRKEDVTADNTILSTQIADKHVAVKNEGALRAVSTRGWIPKLLDLIKVRIS